MRKFIFHPKTNLISKILFILTILTWMALAVISFLKNSYSLMAICLIVVSILGLCFYYLCKLQILKEKIKTLSAYYETKIHWIEIDFDMIDLMPLLESKEKSTKLECYQQFVKELNKIIES